jgi:phosphatidate cytidylyltransferase
VQRVLSTVVLIPAVLYLLFKGGWWFFVPVLVLATLATWEYVRMLHHLDYASSYVFALATLWAILGCTFASTPDILRPALAILLLVSLAWHVLRDRTPTPVENWLLPLAGALYIGWTGGHMFLVRALPQGAYRLFVIFGTTWLADSGAYLVGSAWGKHRMAPRLSPKKTWEGFAGGIGAALIGGPLLSGLGGLGWAHGVFLGLLLALLTPLGDLGVSMIKRQVGVKDSGNLIPGHGGAFDRIDSLLVAVVVGYYYALWAMGVTPPG